MTNNRNIFLLASAVTISLSACGKNGNGSADSSMGRTDSTAMAPSSVPPAMTDSNLMRDSLMRDSLMRDSVRRSDSGRVVDSLGRGRGSRP